MNQNNDNATILNEAIRLAKLGEREPALELVQWVLASEPNNVTALLWLAYLRNDTTEIEATLNQILALDPTNSKALEWLALIHQKETTNKEAAKANEKEKAPQVKMVKAQPKGKPTRAIGTGPLVTSSPNLLKKRVAPLATISDPTPTLNFTDWQQNITTPNTPPVLTQQTTTPLMPDYNIREIQSQQAPPALNPVQIVIQVPDGSKSNQSQNTPGWLIGVMLGLVMLLAIGIGFVLLNQNGGLASVGKPDKSVYKGFNSVEELVGANLESHQRVDVVIPFEGGYVPDANGYVKISRPTKNGALIVNWNTKDAPLTGFHSNQYVRIYGTVEGIGSTITLNVEQVGLER